MMKARTANLDWYTFTIADFPTPLDCKRFALLGKPESPLLFSKEIRRGDPESGLFEGDVISMEDSRWLICYERGFYAINEDYVIRNLYTLTDYEVLGDYKELDFPIPINFKSKQLFKTGDKIFRLSDVTGMYENKLILRAIQTPIPIEDIKQECCITHNGNRVYLGDIINGMKVELHGGRVTLVGETITDIVTGGTLNGYHTNDSE